MGSVMFGSGCIGMLYIRGKHKTSEFWKAERTFGKSIASGLNPEHKAADWKIYTRTTKVLFWVPGPDLAPTLP